MHRVLVGLDLKDSAEELMQALPALRAFGTREVVLTHVGRKFPIPLIHRSDPTLGVCEVLARRRARLNHGFRVELSMLCGDPANELAREAEVRGADAIVVGCEPGSRMREALAGGMGWSLVRRARRPVLLVPTSGREGNGAPLPMVVPSRILHPTDFSPASLDALGAARKLAIQADVSLTLLCVAPEGDEVELDAARLRLSKLADRLRGSGVRRVEEVVAQGVAWQRILEAGEAMEGTLIVLGSRERGLIPEVVLASHSRYVVQRGHGPVMLVPTRGRAAHTNGSHPFSA